MLGGSKFFTFHFSLFTIFLTFALGNHADYLVIH